MKTNLETLDLYKIENWSKQDILNYCRIWKRNVIEELQEINWAETADPIHWGHLERLRNAILGKKGG